MMTMMPRNCHLYLIFLVLLYFLSMAFYLFNQVSKSQEMAKIDETIVSGVKVKDLISLASAFVDSGHIPTVYERRATDFAAHYALLPNKEKKLLLCTTFIKLNHAALNNLLINVKRTILHCDWLVVIYQHHERDKNQLIQDFNSEMHNYSLSQQLPNGTVNVFFTFPRKRSQVMESLYHTKKLYEVELKLKGFRSNLTAAVGKESNIFSYFENTYKFLGLAERSSNMSSLDMFKLDNQRYNEKIIPKSLLFLSILPHLKFYKSLWMMDGDISLVDFDIATFLTIKECAFEPEHRPLVTQALVAENSQTYKYLNSKKWNKNRNVLASYSGFVEIQAPLVDAQFFSWFVVSFVVPMILPSHILGADWGFDELFCKAADYYSRVVRRENRVSSIEGGSVSACALIVGGTPMHHENKKEMNSILGYQVKRRLNKELIRLIYISFPSFVQSGKGLLSDPLYPGSRFEKKVHLKSNCRSYPKFL